MSVPYVSSPASSKDSAMTVVWAPCLTNGFFVTRSTSQSAPSRTLDRRAPVNSRENEHSPVLLLPYQSQDSRLPRPLPRRRIRRTSRSVHEMIQPVHRALSIRNRRQRLARKVLRLLSGAFTPTCRLLLWISALYLLSSLHRNMLSCLLSCRFSKRVQMHSVMPVRRPCGCIKLQI